MFIFYVLSWILLYSPFRISTIPIYETTDIILFLEHIMRLNLIMKNLKTVQNREMNQ